MVMGYNQPMRVIRDVMETCSNFSCALNQLSSQLMIAPCYIALTGTKNDEAVVITRNRTHTVNATYISEDFWYLVQTNDDTYDGKCRERCQAATKNMELLTRNLTSYNSVMYGVLNVKPNLNSLSVYAAVMIPKTGLFLGEIVNGTYRAEDF